MTDRIDHAAEARVLEKNAWARGGPFGDALIRRPVERRDMLASAQVNATLALVEQQRIANLIAWTVGSGYSPSPEITAEIIAALHMPTTPSGAF